MWVYTKINSTNAPEIALNVSAEAARACLPKPHAPSPRCTLPHVDLRRVSWLPHVHQDIRLAVAPGGGRRRVGDEEIDGRLLQRELAVPPWDRGSGLALVRPDRHWHSEQPFLGSRLLVCRHALGVEIIRPRRVRTSSFRRRIDDVRDTKPQRVERIARIPQDELWRRLRGGGGKNGQPDVRRTEAPSFANVFQSFLELPLQTRRIALRHAE